MKADVREMSDGIRLINIDVALMKADVTDLKTATITMSGCIRTLTEASIVSQQNNITREKFYEKMEVFEKRLSATEVVANQIKTMTAWIHGIAATLIVFMILEAYRLLVK
jgi:predicted transcriptional regulator